MSRNLSTTRAQVFGEVSKGTECRICGRSVEDGRRKTCSEFCSNLAAAVMSMLNWDSIRRRIIDRDDETCQACGWDRSRDVAARSRVRARINELLHEYPEGPSMLEYGRGEVDWDIEAHHRRVWRWMRAREELQARYGDPAERGRGLHVDHIIPIADGGHPFDPGNLQTLCDECHADKTATENSERASAPSRSELNESLFEYVAGGGES